MEKGTSKTTTSLSRALCSLCVLAIAGCGGGAGSGGTASLPAPPPAALWHAPSCSLVKGSSALTFTSDGGATRISTETAIAPGDHTYGLAALSTPNTLIAIADSHGSTPKVLISADAGCSWQNGQTLPGADSFAYMVAAGASTYVVDSSALYAVSKDGSVSQLVTYRIFYGFGVDRSDPRHLRSATLAGYCRGSCGTPDIMDSLDGGQTWTTLRYGPYRFGKIYFSPESLDHAIAIDPNAGNPIVVQATTDGGVQWTAPQGLPPGGYPRHLAFSPDGQSVWLLYGSWSHDDSNAGDLYLSRDAGGSFARVRRSSADSPLEDATALYAHPSNPDVLYIVEAIGLYRYDVQLDELLTQSWSLEQGSAWHMVFNPADDRFIYLGLSRDQ